jgi:Beta propeller domain
MRLGARWGWTLIGALTLACVAGLVITPAVTPQAALLGRPAASAAELQPFRDCSELRQWYVKAALPHVTAYGFQSPLNFAERGVELGVYARNAIPDAVGSGPTGTNLQEQGVDEPDFAKTNGEIAVILRAKALIVYDITGDAPTRVGSLRLPDRYDPGNLLLVGDRAVLIRPEQSYFRRTVGYGRPGLPVIPSWTHTNITTVDLSDPSNPRVASTERVGGDVVSAREHEGTVRLVVSSQPRLPFVHPALHLTNREALLENRAIVRAAEPEAWLPIVRMTDATGWSVRPLVDCVDVAYPQRQSGYGTITVLTMDPNDPGTETATGLAADGDMVYASTDRLYVATVEDGWEALPMLRPGYVRSQPTSTTIHAFDTSGDTTTYVASGEVRGLVPSQWGFSEYDGMLRVATSIGQPWRPKDNAVTVLAEQGRRLVPVGSVAGMGEHQTLQAVRWFGDVAVVVTFRQIDPLYTLDLSDPADPKVIGTLKIPGFSAYLHPVGAGVIIGVGEEGSGAEVSLFDLGNLAHPTRVAHVSLGRDTYPMVADDSRAFTYLPTRRVALIPTYSGFGGQQVNAVKVGDDGSLSKLATTHVPISARNVRALPLDDHRFAVVSNGRIVRIVDTADL